ncbi:hypothetical protein ELQ17_03540 [Campylobacter sp. US18a]|nr:hypothetical protein ELQ17_03540 [Campylobacter sp. US18a]
MSLSVLDLWKHNVKPKDALDTTHLAHQFHFFSLKIIKFQNHIKKYIKKSLILEKLRIIFKHVQVLILCYSLC